MTFDALLDTVGRMHPMLVHMPIGLLMGLGGWEMWRAWRGPRRAGRELGLSAVFIAWLSVMGSAAAIGTGLLHELEVGGSDPTVGLHKWLGIGAGVGSLLTAVMAVVVQAASAHGKARGVTRAYRAVLFITIAALVPAGHFGGDITHGEGYLTEPLFRDSGGAGPGGGGDGEGGAGTGQSGAGESFQITQTRALEVLINRCDACHGSARVRGGLRLSAVEDILRGGNDGPAAIAGDPAGSPIVERMRRPIEQRGHMPPSDRPQPTEDEIKLVEEWIRGLGGSEATGAPAASHVGREGEAGEADGGTVERSRAGSGRDSGQELAEPGPASAGAIAALRDRLVHVAPIAAGSNLLWIDLSSLSELDDGLAIGLLSPLREHVAELSLARTRVGDGVMEVVAAMPRLTRLSMQATGLTDAGLAQLARHSAIASLDLVQTRVTDGCVETLATMPKLRRVFVWKTAISAEAVDWLALASPEAVVDTGAEGAGPVETEPEVVVGAASTSGGGGARGGVAGEAVAKAPVNTVCPVTGAPVDARYLVEFEGRTIGFCCPNCPGAFQAEPGRFVGNLPK